MKIRPFFSIKNNMAFNIRIYSAADFDNESIPMQEEDVAFISGFEARNTQMFYTQIDQFLLLFPNYTYTKPILSLVIIGVLLVNS